MPRCPDSSVFPSTKHLRKKKEIVSSFREYKKIRSGKHYDNDSDMENKLVITSGKRKAAGGIIGVGGEKLQTAIVWYKKAARIYCAPLEIEPKIYNSKWSITLKNVNQYVVHTWFYIIFTLSILQFGGEGEKKSTPIKKRPANLPPKKWM